MFLLSPFKSCAVKCHCKRGGYALISYVFKRYELKYLLTQEQYLKVRDEIEKRLSPDVFGKTVIQSLYYDTADDRLVRASAEKPVFKEKLRLRAYGLSDGEKDVYIEMKRKYDGVVYKRRVACKEDEAADIFSGKCPDSQIGKELEYFIRFYGKLSPRMLILYDREAFTDENSDLRVTFDKNVRYRMTDLNLHTSLDGNALLQSGTVLMELKSGTVYIYAGGDGIDSNSRTSYQGILFAGGNITVVSTSGGDSSIDTEQGYTYTGGTVLALCPSNGMGNEAVNCRNFSSIGTKTTLNLSQGQTVNVKVGGNTVASVTMPCRLSALAVYLGSANASFSAE